MPQGASELGVSDAATGRAPPEATSAATSSTLLDLGSMAWCLGDLVEGERARRERDDLGQMRSGEEYARLMKRRIVILGAGFGGSSSRRCCRTRSATAST